MATVNPTSSAADVYAAINAKGTKTATSTTQDMENRFLTLLTTQLKNQDPLNPLDNSQVTSQLAQINTVNGIEKLNSTLSKLLGAYDETQAMQSAAMIGKYVLTPGTSMILTQGQAAGGAKLDGKAENVVVKIMDSSGKVVQTQDLGAREAGVVSFMWDGKDASGTQLADGTYKFSVEATKGTEKVTSTALKFGTVSAITRNGNSFMLDLGAQGTANFDDVQQII
ncbi:MAG: flagellar hook assembly protein FlgD [Betaproteobacteria bacterium]